MTAATALRHGENDVPKTAAPLDVLDQQIVEALAELRGARLDREHSPNSDTELTVEYAERRLDLLFERRGKAKG